MKKQENWKKIVINGMETFYSVSDLGRVRNVVQVHFRGSISKMVIEWFILDTEL